MSPQILPVKSDETLGLVGLFLMLLVAKLANHGGFVADRAIDAIGVIGWTTDHLPLPAGKWRMR